MSIDRGDFAQTCVDASVYCGIFSYLHYLTAIAELRSGISDDTTGDQIGPFRLTQKDWDAFRSDSEFEFNFLASDINLWFMQSHIAALMTYRGQQRLFAKLNRNPSAVELYQDQWPLSDPAKVAADLEKALKSTQDLLAPAVKAFFDADIPTILLSDPAKPPPPQNVSTGKINFDKVPRGDAGKQIAHQIVDDFNSAGFGSSQQIAALANAIGESGLNPNAHAGRGEDSWGLFQLNRNGGLGTGHSRDELVDPKKNTQIIIAAARKVSSFTGAASMEDAVNAFVRSVERPSDIPGQQKARIKIARGLLA